MRRFSLLLVLVAAGAASLPVASLAQSPAAPKAPGQKPTASENTTTVLLSPRPGAKPTAKPAPKQATDGANPAPVSKTDGPLLPAVFAGWTSDPARRLTDPAQADAQNAAALKEYGFTDALTATYTREGESLPVKALRFVDASGGYGAYSFYRHSGWPREQIGAGAASDHNRILFWQGNVVIDAQLPKVTAMSGSDLRELAAAIPVPTGNKSLYPPILGSLPQKEMDGQTTHYALGPLGYAGSGGVLPPELVGFDHGAEVVTATYKLRSGPATLTLINYPTSPIAEVQEKAISGYIQAGNSPGHPWTDALRNSNPAAIEVKRSGPLVAIVTGDAIKDDAHNLIAQVHYEADMASVPQPVDSEVKKTAQLLLSIMTLVLVMFVGAVILALFLGGGRALYRISRGKPVSAVSDEEFIKLDLE
jgi:hypothetical protein